MLAPDSLQAPCVRAVEDADVPKGPGCSAQPGTCVPAPLQRRAPRRTFPRAVCRVCIGSALVLRCLFTGPAKSRGEQAYSQPLPLSFHNVCMKGGDSGGQGGKKGRMASGKSRETHRQVFQHQAPRCLFVFDLGPDLHISLEPHNCPATGALPPCPRF